MDESVIIISSDSDDENHEELRGAKKLRKCVDGVGSCKGVHVSRAEEELRVLSDLSAFPNLAAMIEVEASMRRRKKKKKKKKKNSIEFNPQAEFTVDNGKKGEQVDVVRVQETTQAVETKSLISENGMPQKFFVDDAKEEKLTDPVKDVNRTNPFEAGDGVRSAIVIDLCLSSIEEDEVVADLSSSSGVGQMVPAELIVVDAAKNEEQTNTFKDVDTTKQCEAGDGIRSTDAINPCWLSSEEDEVIADPSKPRGVEEMLLAEPITDVAKEGEQPITVEAVETESITITDLITPQKLLEEKQPDIGKSKDAAISYGTKSAEMKDSIILRKLLRGPRYFDPPETKWGMCGYCGEESHPGVNCTAKKRKKPCFICGAPEHSGMHCKQGRECFFCKGTGHFAKNCPEKHQGTCLSSKFCLRCGDSGHDMWSCNSDYSPDDLKEIECYVCKSFGHLCCSDFPEMGTKPVSCYNCGQSGHLGYECTKSDGDTHGDTSGSKSTALCFRCGEEGHLARGCKKDAKAEKNIGNLLTPQRFPEEKRDPSGSNSAPQDLYKAQKKKQNKSQYKERAGKEDSNQSIKVTGFFRWYEPKENYWKLNFDGSRKHEENSATSGFVIRNDRGLPLVAAAWPVGSASSLMAEALALREGINMAIRYEIKKIQVEGDSLVVIKAMKGDYNTPWSISNIIEDIKLLCNRFDDIEFEHIYRQANRAADHVANLGYHNQGHCWTRDFPETLWRIFHEDGYEVATPKGN